MRAYIRHPSEFPIELGTSEEAEAELMNDVSVGGLSCHSQAELSEGQKVTVRIPVVQPAFEAEGRVVWCRPDKDRYRVGIAFSDKALAFSARMVEQVCHIERYRSHLVEQGQELSLEDAAQDWISKYASRFPR
jgi:hypothetical protein